MKRTDEYHLKPAKTKISLVEIEKDNVTKDIYHKKYEEPACPKV